MPLPESAASEVRDLHAFFQDWFNGVHPYTDAALDRLASVLDDRFVMITPAAAIVTRQAIIEQVRSAHPGDARPDMRIIIDDVDARLIDEHVALVTYIERHRWKDHDADRRSTAVFIPDPAAPNAVAWRHLHETAID